MTVATAASIGVPERFNAAAYFVDRHVADGRGARIAIECGDARITYDAVRRNVNRVGSALRQLGVRREERVLLLLHDTPEFAYAFFGAIKIGAVPVPLNTLWRPADYDYVVRDAAPSAIVVGASLADRIDARQPVTYVENLVTGGDEELAAEDTHRDAPAFWLYSSGSTGAPKGCVHLQHDMVVCATLFGQNVLALGPRDRTFSVAKLFFAYGLGNALYFPFAVGATTVLWPGTPAPANVYAVIERYRPTLFYSVPTGYGMMLAHPRAPTGGADDRADFDQSSVRLAVSAGEALPVALYERFKQRFGIDIIDGIGSTEALHMFISNRRDAIRPGSSGLVVPGYEARLVDERGEP